jgi:hypothetical protein
MEAHPIDELSFCDDTDYGLYLLYSDRLHLIHSSHDDPFYDTRSERDLDESSHDDLISPYFSYRVGIGVSTETLRERDDGYIHTSTLGKNPKKEILSSII